jgi:formylmethanofuran dehydrogenase subunit E
MDANYSLYQRREREQERWLAQRPVCSYCDEHVQDDECYLINGEVICQSCLDLHFKKNVEDLCE